MSRRVIPFRVDPGAYTIAQVRERISMSRSTFFRLRDQGDLPFLEEVKPRLGRLVRYRADLVDQFVANQFNRAPSRLVHGRQSAGASPARHFNSHEVAR